MLKIFLQKQVLKVMTKEVKKQRKKATKIKMKKTKKEMMMRKMVKKRIRMKNRKLKVMSKKRMNLKKMLLNVTSTDPSISTLLVLQDKIQVTGSHRMKRKVMFLLMMCFKLLLMVEVSNSKFGF